MRRSNTNSKENGNFYTVNYRAKNPLEVKEIMDSHQSGVSGYTNRHLFTTKLIEYVYPHFKRQIDKINFKGFSLTQIDYHIKQIISNYHSNDIEISFLMPEPLDDLIIISNYNYTKSQCYLQQVVPILKEENFSPYILNAFHYIKYKMNVPVVDYGDQMLEFYKDMKPEKYEGQSRGSYLDYMYYYLSTVHDWEEGLPYTFNLAISLKPNISVEECYKNINNKTVKGLMKLLMEGYMFSDISNNKSYPGDERPVPPDQYIGFLWDYNDDCEITKMHCEHLDEYLGNDEFDDIIESHFLTDKSLKEKIQPNKQLVEFLKLMSCH
jgi:hypothetical protein